MKNILVLGVASVQEDLINKLKEMGYFVHAIAMKKDGPGAKQADKFIEINIINVEEVTNYIKENNIYAVYSVGSDLAIPVIEEISEKLCLPHFNSYNAAKISNNKDLMRSITHGINGNVAFEITNSYEHQTKLNYPIFVKPTDGQGQRSISLVENENEIKQALKLA